jgi:hypothetical protein
VRSRRAVTALLAALLAAGALPARAGFGIFKNRLTLPRTRPPEIPLLAESVALEVEAGGPEIEGAFVDDVRERLERALTAGDLYRLAERPREADARVRVTLQRLRAEVRDELREEYRRVKVGEREEWNDKKKKYETKDVYADRRENVAWRVAEGSLSGEVRVLQRDGDEDRRDLSATFGRDVKKADAIPAEMRSEDELRRFLVDAVAEQAVAAVAFGADPVEALLATNGPLKPGNKLLEDGRVEEALRSWETLRLKGGDEAARRHNLGVAHEALAYRLAPFTPEHRAELDAAAEHYRAARLLDAKEKYFAPPVERIEQSLGYAERAARLHDDLQRLRRERPRARRDEAPRDERPRGTRPPEPAPRATPAPQPQGVAASGGLRNVGFEQALPPWTVAGQAALVSEDGHGRVLELTAAKAPAQATHPLAFEVGEHATAVLALLYRVAAGEARLRVSVNYDDATGKRRTSSLEVSNGEAPGGWSDWSHDLAALRPRPVKLHGLTISVEAGRVRLDDVMLE